MKIKSECLLFLILLSGLLLSSTLMFGAAKSVLVNGKAKTFQGEEIKLGFLLGRTEIACRF